MTRPTTCAMAILGALLLGGCRREVASDDGPFRHEMVASGELDVEVRTANGPVAGALVWVRETSGGPPLWQGATTRDGHARGKLSLPTTTEKVSVVVNHPSFEGPWSAARPRSDFGPFAPSSWQLRPAADLGRLVVEMEARR